jgi:hypothetical protein
MSSPMMVRCPGCGWSWGPVGVRPYSPDGPRQLFLVCGACARPQARIVAPEVDHAELPCDACGAGSLRPLSHCPRCGDASLAWGPMM